MVQPENNSEHRSDNDSSSIELISKFGTLAGYGITAHFYGRALGGTVPTEINNDFLVMLGEGKVAVWGTCSAVSEGLKSLGAYREKKFQERVDKL